MPGSNGYEKKIKLFLNGIKKKLEE